MKFTFVSVFPNLIEPYFEDSILLKARKNGLIELNFVNPRDFSSDLHKKTDDYKIGGGAGMLMNSQPLCDALAQIVSNSPKTHIIFLSPVGKKFTQNDAKRLAKKSDICFVCGRYEGIDERVSEIFANEIFCIGDFVLTGGELSALCVCDAISRNLKGVLGNENSLNEESFEEFLLEAPAFSKPDKFMNLNIISEFLKGNHAKINALKTNMAICKTAFYRPDLLKKYNRSKGK